MSKYKRCNPLYTNYKRELPKLQRLLNKAYEDYDADKIYELRELRKQYKEAIEKNLVHYIGELNVSPEYEDTGDGISPFEWHEAYLESMYSSGVPMNQAQTKALELVRGTKS